MTGPKTGLGFGSVFDVTTTNAAFDFVRHATRESSFSAVDQRFFYSARSRLRHSKSNGIMLASIGVN
jgi:hypothetical protein